MANAREILSRMKSVQDTRKITNAMYLISSTKLKKSKKLLEEYGAEAVFVTEDKNVLVTDGLKEAFELMDEAYQLKEETNEREKAAK